MSSHETTYRGADSYETDRGSHSAFRIEAGTAKLLIDPFLSDNASWDKRWTGYHRVSIGDGEARRPHGQAQGANWRRRHSAKSARPLVSYTVEVVRSVSMTRAGGLYRQQNSFTQAAYRGLFPGDIYAARGHICYTDRFLSHP